jgi:hypothetical protein
VAPIEFGIFDHVTRPPGIALDELYEGRLALLRKADAAGFDRYHLAEHHGHGLSATPSPAVFLAAVARETERLRIGMLVACLPLHLRSGSSRTSACSASSRAAGSTWAWGAASRRSSTGCSATTPTSHARGSAS